MPPVVIREALTFDDVLLEPARSEVLPAEVDVRTRLTREIELGMPLISAAMDTVTEANLAIAMAQHGGLGVIHRNLDVAAQAAEVQKVKKFEAGMVVNPITLGPDATLADALDLMAAHRISGIPVVEGAARRLVGILTNRDVRFATDTSVPVRALMTADDLVTVPEGVGRDEAKQLLHQHRIEKLLVVDDDFRLIGLMTVKDIEKAQRFPHACKDAHGRLRAGAAVGTGPAGLERAEALIEAGVDVLVVDTAHGHSAGVLDSVARVRRASNAVQVIAGNVATAAGARALIDAGADGIKVGIGPGSICTTRVIAGVGVPQVSAVAEVANALKDRGVPLISDGGIRYSGDIAKALVAGAYAVMIGSLFAGTEESPGEVELYQGRSYKTYRGMGSLGAMGQTHGSSDRYFQDATEELEKLVPEGIEGRVAYKGSVVAIVHQLMGGVRAAMGYTGSHNIDEMRTRPKFVKITSAGMRESHVHDVTITKEAPNYRSNS
jgi:IMP dehydrogenase